MTPTPRDADLLARIAVGDRAAFEAFYRRHAVWLALRLRYRCADTTLVDDVVQETFLDLWRGGAAHYREPGDVTGWLWRIGSRRLIDALRRQGAWDRLRQMLSWFRPSSGSSAESSAEDLVLRGVEHGDLGGALARLSPELRAVVQATVLDGLSTGEISVPDTDAASGLALLDRPVAESTALVREHWSVLTDPAVGVDRFAALLGVPAAPPPPVEERHVGCAS